MTPTEMEKLLIVLRRQVVDHRSKVRGLDEKLSQEQETLQSAQQELDHVKSQLKPILQAVFRIAGDSEAKKDALKAFFLSRNLDPLILADVHSLQQLFST